MSFNNVVFGKRIEGESGLLFELIKEHYKDEIYHYKTPKKQIINIKEKGLFEQGCKVPGILSLFIFIEYVIPVKESKKLKLLKEDALKNPKKRARKYEIKGKYVKGKGFSPHRFKIGFFVKKVLRFSALRARYRKEPGALLEILSNFFVLATNQSIRSPCSKRKIRIL